MMDVPIRAWAEEHGTPFYLLDVERARSELSRLRDAFQLVYAQTRLAYSVKTNYLPPLILAAHQDGHLIEVVSRHEWEHVRALGVSDVEVIFNGPVKSVADLKEAHRAGVSFNVDSMAELQTVAELSDELGLPVPAGLRISPRLPNGRQSRFGLHPDDVAATVPGLLRDGRITVRGLHLHYSMDRSAESYRGRVDLLSMVADRLGVAPRYIDIGGGLASDLPPSVREQLGYDVSTFDEYASAAGGAMRDRWGAGGPTLILEPGTATLSGAMSYVTSVVSTRPDEGTVVVDGTMFETNPLQSKVHPPIRRLAGSGQRTTRSTVYGATCMEIDVLGELREPVDPGDVLLIENVGAYSVVLAPQFIVSRAGVLDAASGEVVRQPAKVGDLGGPW